MSKRRIKISGINEYNAVEHKFVWLGHSIDTLIHNIRQWSPRRVKFIIIEDHKGKKMKLNLGDVKRTNVKSLFLDLI